MPLDTLLTLVEKLHKRIETHGSVLSEREERTRYALIDPLLRELGWDTADPDLVSPEYKTEDGRPDYALLGSDGKPIMMVEAKKLGKGLQEGFTQALAYCMEKGTRYCSVTDGRHWEIYDTHKPVPKEQKLIVSFDLKDPSATEVCLDVLALWKLRMSGHIGAGQAPDGGLTHSQLPLESPPPSPPPRPPKKWQSLSKLNPKTGALPPVEIQFPDNSFISVKKWSPLLVEVVHWLIKNNYLTRSHCPILSKPKGKTHCAVHTESTHLSGKSFTLPVEIQSFYVETSLNVEAVVIAARNVIKSVGQKPVQFKVRFS